MSVCGQLNSCQSGLTQVAHPVTLSHHLLAVAAAASVDDREPGAAPSFASANLSIINTVTDIQCFSQSIYIYIYVVRAT